MATAVAVPWQPGCPRREAIWSWVRRRYESEHPDWDILEGTHTGPWCKAAAVADALSRTTADRIVIADADVLCEGLTEAVDALDDYPWARPHHDVHRLTGTATAGVMGGGFDRSTDPPPYHGVDGGGLVAIRRDVYEDVPLDPRFIGWGGEDLAWGFALSALISEPFRGQAPLLHLWHPPQPDAAKRRGPGGGRFLNDNNREWLEAYKHARPDPPRMRVLVDQAKEHDGERQSGHQPVGDPAAPTVH